MVKQWIFRVLLMTGVFFFSGHAVFAQSPLAQGFLHDVIHVHFDAGQERVIEAPFLFQAFALSEVTGVEVRFLFQQSPHGKEKWTSWQHLELEEEGLPGSELLFVASSRAFELRSSVAQKLQVTLIQIPLEPFQLVQDDRVALDVSLSAEGKTQEGDLRIISRKEWGADEAFGTYLPREEDKSVADSPPENPVNICAPIEEAYPAQFRVNGKAVYNDESGRPLIWPRTYSDRVKKMVIHHTAQTLRDLNDDGRLDRRDYRLGLQAIYVYHTKTRGWGDIGYHYIVDPDGAIYEGRAGGRAVVGAHVLCQNSNTVGVSVMGNFEEEALPKKAFEGLVRITTYLAELYDMNPLGKSSFRGEVLPNIVTHAEIGEVTKQHIGQGATACPGKFLKSQMADLRKIVSEGGIRPDYSFQLVSDTKPLEFGPLQSFEILIKLKNSGEQTWKKAQLLDRKKVVVALDGLNIAPEQILEIKVPFSSELEAGLKKQSLSLLMDDLKMKKVIAISYRVEKPVYRYALVTLEGDENPLLMGESRTLSVKLKNTSNFPWLVDGPYQFQLQQIIRRGRTVVAVPKGIQLNLDQDVSVGQEVVLETPLPLQKKEGRLSFEFLPMIGRGQGLNGEHLGAMFTVETPKFVAEVGPVEKRVQVQKGFSEEVDFRIQNKSNFDWEPGMIWYQIGRGEKKVVDQEVKKGEGFVFPALVRSGYDDREVEVKGVVGIDRLPKNIVLKNFRKAKLSFQEVLKTIGTVRLSAEKLGQSDEKLLPQIGISDAWVELKNTGTVPWYREGEDRIELRVKDNPDFADRSWKRKKIAGVLEQEMVMPGETGKFLLKLAVKKVPKRTIFDRFELFVGKRKVNVKDEIKFGVAIEGTREKKKRSRTNYQLPTTNYQLPAMRVWLTELKLPVVEVTSPGSFIVWDSKTVQIIEQPSESVVTVRTEDLGEGVIVRIRAKDAPYLELKNFDRKDKRFRGVLEFRLIDGVVTVINEVPLEDYMKGIAEVPESDDQPQEKRKVIAVLARTYALHYLISGYEKFPGKPYNAADSPAIFQKYLGYGFEERAPRWQEVVKETEGEVVMVDSSEFSSSPSGLRVEDRVQSSENERVLRAAYFSCTDGTRTKSWDEVWPDNTYFQRFGFVFQSVDDPLGDDPTREGIQRCGHQVGLSGYGATQMAKPTTAGGQGKGYREIIDYYYRGVSVEHYRSPN